MMNLYEATKTINTLSNMKDDDLHCAIENNIDYFLYAVATGRNTHHWVSYLQKASMSQIKSCVSQIDADVLLTASQTRQELTFFLTPQSIWDSSLTNTRKITLMIKHLLEKQDFGAVPKECWQYINKKDLWYKLFPEESSGWRKLNTEQQQKYQKQLWNTINQYHIEPALSFEHVDIDHYSIDDNNRVYIVNKFMQEPLSIQLKTVIEHDRLWESIYPMVSVDLKNEYFLWKLKNNHNQMSNLSDYMILRDITLSWDEVAPYFNCRQNYQHSYDDNLPTLFMLINHKHWKNIQDPGFNAKNVRLAKQIHYLLQLNTTITELFFDKDIEHILSKNRFSAIRSTSVKEDFIELDDILEILSKNIHAYIPKGWFPHLHCEFKEEEALHLS